MMKAQQPDLKRIDLDERKPSRRYDDDEVHHLWSLNSQEEQYQLPLPVYFKKDRVVQELLAFGNVHIGMPPTDTEVAPSPTDTETSRLTPEESPQPGLIEGEITQKKPTSKKTKQSKNSKKSGKGGVPSRKDQDARASGDRLCGQRAPAMKNVGLRKKKTKTRVPEWLHSLLEQPTQRRSTRSNESKIFIELDKHCQVVLASPPPTKKAVRASRISGASKETHPRMQAGQNPRHVLEDE